MRFRDRTDAGRRLAAALHDLELVRPTVLALPRGGVPVAFEVAAALHAPLEVFVARKIGAPDQPEYGIGAVAEDGPVVTSPAALRALGLSREGFDRLAERERAEVDRRVRDYRGDRPLPDLAGHDVLLVDDGLATGVTAEAALLALRSHGARRLLLAVPVCAPRTADRLRGVADDIRWVHAPAGFSAVAQWYETFPQTSDAEVRDLLARARPAAGVRP